MSAVTARKRTFSRSRGKVTEGQLDVRRQASNVCLSSSVLNGTPALELE